MEGLDERLPTAEIRIVGHVQKELCRSEKAVHRGHSALAFVNIQTLGHGFIGEATACSVVGGGTAENGSVGILMVFGQLVEHIAELQIGPGFAFKVPASSRIKHVTQFMQKTEGQIKNVQIFLPGYALDQLLPHKSPVGVDYMIVV